MSFEVRVHQGRTFDPGVVARVLGEPALPAADVIEGALPALPAEAAALPASLRAAAAEGQDDQGVARRALQNVRTTLASGTGALVGNALLAGVSGVLAHFGVPLA